MVPTKSGPRPERQTDVVALMQAHIREGALEEFAYDDVVEWYPGEPELVDGKRYQTGEVVYRAETIFGMKNVRARAYISGGKVAKWTWPKAGTEIR